MFEIFVEEHFEIWVDSFFFLGWLWKKQNERVFGLAAAFAAIYCWQWKPAETKTTDWLQTIYCGGCLRFRVQNDGNASTIFPITSCAHVCTWCCIAEARARPTVKRGVWLRRWPTGARLTRHDAWGGGGRQGEGGSKLLRQFKKKKEEKKPLCLWCGGE